MVNQKTGSSLTASGAQGPVPAGTDILIRAATIDDAPVIADFNIAMAFETENLELPAKVTHAGVRGVFEKPERGQYLVADRDGHVVGCLLLTREWSDWRNAEFWWIQSVYVAPNARKQGVYKALYSYAHKMAESKGDICGFRLYVEKDNQRAQQTYRQQGMEETHYLIYEQMTGTDS